MNGRSYYLFTHEKHNFWIWKWYDKKKLEVLFRRWIGTCARRNEGGCNCTGLEWCIKWWQKREDECNPRNISNNESMEHDN